MRISGVTQLHTHIAHTKSRQNLVAYQLNWLTSELIVPIELLDSKEQVSRKPKIVLTQVIDKGVDDIKHTLDINSSVILRK